jgi:hypothetical protein
MLVTLLPIAPRLRGSSTCRLPSGSGRRLFADFPFGDVDEAFAHEFVDRSVAKSWAFVRCLRVVVIVVSDYGDVADGSTFGSDPSSPGCELPSSGCQWRTWPRPLTCRAGNCSHLYTRTPTVRARAVRRDAVHGAAELSQMFQVIG